MAGDLDDLADAERRLCEALAAYFDAANAGEVPERELWLARYPELAGELVAFLEQQDRLLHACGPLRSVIKGKVGVSSPTPIDGPACRSAPYSDEPDHDTASPAVQVFGDYELIGEPTHGGMSVVYRALQRSLNRPVALKMLRGGTLADRDDVRRFRLEAEAVANLDHPNIVPIYEVGEHDGRRYFAMKLIDGGSVAQRLAEFRPNPRAAASLMATVARAVHHAHQRGILHRDLKPSNIVIDGEGQPHVTDFGLAKRVEGNSELTQSGAILGTPSYMAPEQASGNNKAITTATDVYGLGAILYALLTGKPPFRGITVLETLEQVRQQPPEPPSGVGREVDRDLETICLKCLEKEPERRYASALALAEDLERWLRGEPTLARPLSRPARLRRWAWRRRRRLAAGAAALVMLVLIGLGTGQAIRLRQAGRLVEEQQSVIRGRDEEARKRYVSDIGRALVLITEGKAKEAREHLDLRVPAPGTEDIRGFEWYYLRRLTDASRTNWIGHERKEVYHLEYAPDGRTFVTAGQDRTARIWDVDTGQQRLVLGGHDDEVDYARFDPSGTRVVTAGDDATVRIWSAADGRLLTVLDRLPSPTVNAQFTPDGRDVIAAARDGTIVRWDAATGRRRATFRQGHPGIAEWVETIAISPNGTILACTGKNGVILLLDLSEGGLAAVSKPMASMNTNGLCVAFAPDGCSLAATGTSNVHAFLYDTATGKTQVALEGPTLARNFTLAFAPDGRTLAVGDDLGAVRIWDVAKHSCLVSLLGHTDRIWCVAFAPDGRSLATVSRDGSIRTWDATGRADRVVFRGLARIPMRPRYDNRAGSVAFSADGTQVLAASVSGCVLACDLRDGTARTVKTADRPVHETLARIAPDGTSVVVLELTPGTKIEDWRFRPVIYDLSQRRGPISLPLDVGPHLPFWSPDGRRLALAERTGDLTLWDGGTGRLLGRAAAGFGGGTSPTFLPKGDVVIAVCGEDNARPRRPFDLVFWKPATSQLERQTDPRTKSRGPLGISFWPPMARPWRTAPALALCCGTSPPCGGDSCWLVTAGM